MRIASKADIVHYIFLHSFLAANTLATMLGSTVFSRFLLFQFFLYPCLLYWSTQSHSRMHKRTLEYGSPILMFYWVKDAINSVVLTVFKNFIQMIFYNPIIILFFLSSSPPYTLSPLVTTSFLFFVFLYESASFLFYLLVCFLEFIYIN